MMDEFRQVYRAPNGQRQIAALFVLNFSDDMYNSGDKYKFYCYSGGQINFLS